MSFLTNELPGIKQQFARVRTPIQDPATLACMQIVQLRTAMLAHAQANGNVLLDEKNAWRGVKPEKYKDTIKHIVSLFKQISHTPEFFTHCSTITRETAMSMKRRPDIEHMRMHWTQMDYREKMSALRDISELMVNSFNKSEPVLCMNYPTMAAATFPEATRTVIGMQIQHYHHSPSNDCDDENYKVLMHLISVNRETLDKAHFNQAVAMLWHEHQHMYMGALRASLQQGFIKPDHPFYQDVQNSDTVHKYKITGNIAISKDIYHAEPEEALCAHIQDVFEKVFSFIPPINLNIADGIVLKIRHG